MRPSLAAAVAVAVAALPLVVGMALGWPGTAVDCQQVMCFCETLRPGLVRQPVNTWSNLVPVLAAFVVAGVAQRRTLPTGASALGAERFFSYAFPIALVWQGFGSAVYHASLVEWAGALDASSMLTTVTLLLLANLTRGGVVQPSWLLPCWLMGLALGGALGLVAPTLVSAVMFLAFLSVLASEVWLARRGVTGSTRWFRGGIAIFVVGIAVWTFSLFEGQALCEADASLQAHAVWHITSGLAIAAFARHTFVNLQSNKRQSSPSVLV